MSIPAIYFAFHVDTAHYIWDKLKAAPRIFWPKTEDKKNNEDDDGKYSKSLILFILKQTVTSALSKYCVFHLTEYIAKRNEPLPKKQATVDKDNAEVEKCQPNDKRRNDIMGRVRRLRVFK